MKKEDVSPPQFPPDDLQHPLNLDELSPAEMRHLLHQLQTRQLELQEQNEALRQIFKSVSDAVIVTDLDFTIQRWNPAAEALYGWPAA